jgi:hypothetical protein
MMRAFVGSIMAFNVRSFLEQIRLERRRRAIVYCAISATATIGVLCTVLKISENSCERALGFETNSALDRKLETEGGTLDPDGPLSLRPALDPVPIDLRSSRIC